MKREVLTITIDEWEPGDANIPYKARMVGAKRVVSVDGSDGAFAYQFIDDSTPVATSVGVCVAMIKRLRERRV